MLAAGGIPNSLLSSTLLSFSGIQHVLFCEIVPFFLSFCFVFVVMLSLELCRCSSDLCLEICECIWTF